MAVDTLNLQIGKLSPTQELNLTRSLAELSAGQLIKAVIVNRISDNQVVLGINGQTVNAKTTRPYLTGEVLNVKVVKTADETLLQVQPNQVPTLTKLQMALAQALPGQWPATHLLATLQALGQANNLPSPLQMQIRDLLTSFATINQLPQQLAMAMSNSGYFYESKLLNLRNTPNAINSDFKGQLLKLISLINAQQEPNQLKIPTPYTSKDSLPLAGALPHPHHRFTADLQNQSISQVLSLLHDQAKQVIARIQSTQINHLLNSPDPAVNLLLEIPLQVLDHTELVSFLLTKNNTTYQTKDSWSIHFALHLSELGDLQAKVNWQNAIINVEFHVEKASTVALLDEQQQTFAELLHSSGIQLNGWILNHGLQQDEIDTTHIKLLDIQA